MKSLSLRCCCSNGEALINLLSASACWDSVKHKDVEEFTKLIAGFENPLHKMESFCCFLFLTYLRKSLLLCGEDTVTDDVTMDSRCFRHHMAFFNLTCSVDLKSGTETLQMEIILDRP